MNILYVLIPLSIVLVTVAILGFFWAVRNNQFDDLDTPAINILNEDDGDFSSAKGSLLAEGSSTSTECSEKEAE